MNTVGDASDVSDVMDRGERERKATQDAVDPKRVMIDDVIV